MSRSVRALAAVLAAAVAAVVAVVVWAPPDRAFLLGGIQVNEADHGHWFDALRRAGMNTVSATVYAKQGDWDTDNLWWEEEEQAVVLEIRGAASRGLHVVLIPRVALDHAFPRNRFLWHGLIMPRDDALLEAWFDRYRAFVLKWAAVARDEGVDVFAVGSELNALASTVPLEAVPDLERYYLDADRQAARKDAYLAQAERVDPAALEGLDRYLDAESGALRDWAAQTAGDDPERALSRLNRRRARLEQRWRDLIAAVREVFPGRLTYAANFDQYREVGFWDSLDMIGINAYFPLREPGAPVPGERELRSILQDGWRGVLGGIDAFRQERGLPDRPVLFTEIGYARRAGVTLAPWAGTGHTLIESQAGEKRLMVWDDQPPDLAERALAVRALHDVHLEYDGRLLRGLLYWKLSTEPAHLDVEPFVHILGAEDDPMRRELARFAGRLRLQRLTR